MLGRNPRSCVVTIRSISHFIFSQDTEFSLSLNLSCTMGIKIKIYEGLHWLFQHVFFPWDKWWPVPLGLIPLIVHRDILNAYNLLPAPLPPTLDGDGLQDPKYRSDDGSGTDKYNPTASMEGAPIGRNCPTVVKHLRGSTGDPDVQLVAVSGYISNSLPCAMCLTRFPTHSSSITATSSCQRLVHASR
jgi:hypothetical protein